MQLMAYGATDHGRRRAQNQDTVLCFTLPTPNAAVGLYAVADGMGGQNAGEVASQISIETVRDDLWQYLEQEVGPLLHDGAEVVTGRLSEDDQAEDRSSPAVPLRDAVSMAIQRSNQRIREFGDANPESAGLGSTLTLAMVINDLALIGNVGDSRTYLVRNGQISRLTQDHSLVHSLVQQGVISDEEVYSHPQRNLVYQALGTRAEIAPDIFMQRLQEGDTLILCSDGLWEMVRDEQIRQIIEAQPDPTEAATTLVHMANTNGGVDNISVVVVRVS